MKMLAAVAALTAGSLIAATPMIRRLDGSRISTAEAETYARRILTEARVTGAQVAVVDRGKLVWSAAFGMRRREPALAMETGTTTWAASITKSVFATYVMQLVERGQFSLDVPVAKQMAQALDRYEPYRETAAELVRDPAWPKVTPRHLLSHTSGLANFAFLEPDKKMRLAFAPGANYRYSGEGINLLQFVIEQKDGRNLDGLMQEALFTPLQMASTGMTYRADFSANIADRYDAQERFIAQTRRSPARAAGSMTSSAEDLARFAIALMNGKLLKPATRTRMFAVQIPIRTKQQFDLEAKPESAEAAQVGLAYGLGWGLLTKTKFGPAFFKEGHGDGAQTYLICFSKQKSCMILMTNSDNGERTFRPLMEKIFGNTVTPWEWEGY